MEPAGALRRTQLCVTIDGAEFAKDFQYFMTVQLEGESDKRRTDVSEKVRNPIWSANVFYLPIPGNELTPMQRLLFAVFVVTDRDVGKGKGQARLLGECTLDLGPIAPAIQETTGAGIRQHLKFTRSQEGQSVTVGRFLVSLKLVHDEDMAVALDRPVSPGEIIHPLPAIDPFSEFSWRIRVDFRAAIDVPMNKATTTGLPSPYMEFGWSNYVQQRPAENEMIRSVTIKNNRHPIWNQQDLFMNPPSVTNVDGFIWASLKDQMQAENLESINIPLSAMRSFHPVHLQLLSSHVEFETRSKMYMSMTIEEAIKSSFVDHLVDIAVQAINFDPLPMATNKIMIAMTTHGHKLTEIPWIVVDLMGEMNLARELLRHKGDRQSVFLSPVLTIAPSKTDNQYGAQAIFTIPRSYLDNQLSFYLIVRDEALQGIFPNSIVSYTEILDDELQSSLYAKRDKTLFVPMAWISENPMYRIFAQSKCTLQLSVFSLDRDEESGAMDNSRMLNMSEMDRNPQASQLAQSMPRQSQDTRGGGMSMMMPEGAGVNRERWEVLTRELQQKQEMVHRLMREKDEQSEALKLTGSEIVELRRQIKLLQSENMILRQRLNEEEAIDVQTVVSKEVERMNNEELKNKIIKIAQMYRNERMRNEEFERVIKKAQTDITEAYKYKAELEELQTKHEGQLRQLQKIQTQVERANAYKETIKKQEKVIAKLETLMEKTLQDTQKARDSAIELEKLRTENIELQRRLKEVAFGTSSGAALDQAQEEVRRLERLVFELREELKSKRPVTSEGQADWEKEKLQLELQLQKAEFRVQSMQDELDSNAVKFAKEIGHYKGLLAEKQSLIDTMQMDVDQFRN